MNIMSESSTAQAPPRSELQVRLESRPGAPITVHRIEIPREIKAAISDRIAAAKTAAGK
jgi:hypothetical protein